MYTVVIPHSVRKQLIRLPEQARKRVGMALQSLTTNPRLGKALKGEYAGYFSMRVWPYRILYRIEKQQLLVVVVEVGHRQGVYG